MKAFETFKVFGIKYVAVPKNSTDGCSVHIVSESGDNLGAWYSVETFKIRMKSKTREHPQLLGKAQLSVRV